MEEVTPLLRAVPLGDVPQQATPTYPYPLPPPGLVGGNLTLDVVSDGIGGEKFVRLIWASGHGLTVVDLPTKLLDEAETNFAEEVGQLLVAKAREARTGLITPKV